MAPPSHTHFYAVLQLPLGDKKAPGLAISTLVRGLKMQIHVTSRDAATLTYDSQFAYEASGPAAWTAASKQPGKPTKTSCLSLQRLATPRSCC